MCDLTVQPSITSFSEMLLSMGTLQSDLTQKKRPKCHIFLRGLTLAGFTKESQISIITGWKAAEGSQWLSVWPWLVGDNLCTVKSINTWCSAWSWQPLASGQQFEDKGLRRSLSAGRIWRKGIGDLEMVKSCTQELVIKETKLWKHCLALLLPKKSRVLMSLDYIVTSIFTSQHLP